MGWDRRFRDELPGGIRSLLDAGEFIIGLPRTERAQPHWLKAAECVMAAANGKASMRRARVALLKALNHSIEPSSFKAGRRARSP